MPNSSISVYACNNGHDASPTWEDMTTEFLNKEYYSFTNTTKTAENWGIKVKVEITKDTDDTQVKLSAIGLTFK